MPDERVEHPSYEPDDLRPYEYWARVAHVVDGDTVDLTVTLHFDLTFDARFRLLGIDTPEMFGIRHSSPEYARGVESRECLHDMIPPGTWVEVRTYKGDGREKYGRFLYEIFVDGRNVCEEMLLLGVTEPR